jgi:hypothetical protein
MKAPDTIAALRACVSAKTIIATIMASAPSAA